MPGMRGASSGQGGHAGRPILVPRTGEWPRRLFPLFVLLWVAGSLLSCQKDRITTLGQEGAGECQLNRTRIDFGTVTLSASAVDSFTLRNVGAGTLSGRIREQCGSFDVIRGAGSYSLGPGQRRVVVIRFQPSEAGEQECAVAVGGSCRAVQCAGLGEPPPLCEVSPTHLDFDTVTVNSSSRDLQFVIRNAGDGVLQGAVRATCPSFTLLQGDSAYSLGAKEEKSFIVRFTPTVQGFQTCTISTGTACLDAVTCQGVGDREPLCALSAQDLDFGTVLVGASASRDFSLSNDGGGVLRGVVSVACPSFSLVSADSAYALRSGQSQTFTIRFQPGAAAQYSCEVPAGQDCPPLACFGFGASPPSGACCFPDGSCRSLPAAGCAQAGGAYGGDDTSCEPNPCPQPTGACCFHDGSCRVLTSEACAQNGGTYQGNNSPCDPNPCPQPTGSCCFADGSCQVQASAACSQAGGVYQGNDSPCLPNPCPQPTGACCLADGSCRLLTAAACSQAGGAYQGNNSPCDPNPCPQPTGACCYTNGTCQTYTAAECAESSGAYQGNFTSCSPNPCQQPTGACCFADGHCTLTTQADCGGSYLGVGISCEPNPCPQPTGACCFSDGTCQLLTSAACGQAAGIYQGDGHACLPNPCPQPTGACCAASGSCQLLTAAACGTAGGAYQGNGIACVPNPCPQPTGACCFANGSCQALTAAACGVAGGAYQGDGSGCAPNPCPQPTGACCFADGSCQLRTSAQCGQLGGIYHGDSAPCSPNPCPRCEITPAAHRLDFGTVALGGFADRQFSITNTGGSLLSGNVTLNCQEFSTLSGDGPFSLGPGASRTVAIRYVPLQAGDATCMVELNTGLCPEVTLAGHAELPPACSVSATDLDFGLVVADGVSSATRTFEISNTGGGLLSGTITESCTNYTITDGASYSLGAGEAQTVTVRFRPAVSAFGTQTCTLHLGSLCSDVICTGQGAPGFAYHVRPALENSCSGCHYSNSGIAVLTDYSVLVSPQHPLVSPGDPPQSLLLLKPSGQQSHGGGILTDWTVGSVSYNLVLLWIQLGALNN